MSEEKSMVKGFLLGILAGGVTGSLIALLYAPKSGRELRKDIVNKKNELMEDAEQYLENAKIRANELISESRRKAESMIDEAKKKVGGLGKNTGELYNSGVEKVSKFKDAGKSGINAYNEEREKSSSSR
jgi:gas vesicle protein